MLISIGAPFLDVSSSNEKCEYLNLSKLSKFSKLLWKANSLAKRKHGLVRSSCFILVLKHSDWHSLKGSSKFFDVEKGKYLLTAKDLVRGLKNLSCKKHQNSPFLHCILLPSHQQWHSHQTFYHQSCFEELPILFIYIFSFEVDFKFNSPRPFFFSSSVATKKTMFDLFLISCLLTSIHWTIFTNWLFFDNFIQTNRTGFLAELNFSFQLYQC